MNKLSKSICFSIGIFFLLPIYTLKADTTKSWVYGGFNMGATYTNSSYETTPHCAATAGGGVFCSTGAFEQNGKAVASTGDGIMSGTSFLGGVQIGKNWQNDKFIYGGEVDFDIFNLRKSVRLSGAFPVTFLGNAYTLTESVSADWLSTIRGRGAYKLTGTPLIVYGTAGLAITNYKVASRYYDNAIDATYPGGFGHGQKTHLKLGIAVGAGSELVLSDDLSIKAEYLYINFDSVNLPVRISNTSEFFQKMRVNFKLDAHVFRLGFNYKLDSLIDSIGQNILA